MKKSYMYIDGPVSKPLFKTLVGNFRQPSDLRVLTS